MVVNCRSCRRGRFDGDQLGETADGEAAHQYGIGDQMDVVGDGIQRVDG